MDQKKNNSPKDGLFIPSRRVAAYTSLALSVCGVLFMGGYFLGKQHMVEQLVSQIEQDSFADQISASLCALYNDEVDTTHVAEVDAPETRLCYNSFAGQAVQTEHVNQSAALHSQETSADTASDEHTERYYAQLIGYGTQKAAEQFAQKLQKKGMPVYVKQRQSKTAQGKQRNWFQVVTEQYSDRTVLEKLTQQIAKEEKIRDIQVVSC